TALNKYRERILRYSLAAGAAILVLQTAAYLGGGRWMVFFWATPFLGVSMVFMWLVGNAASGFSGRLGRLLEFSPLLYVGRISYGMYLFHAFMPPLVSYIAATIGLSQPRTSLMFFLASGLT